MMDTEPTYWNGEPCAARRVIVVVDKSPKPTWWCANLEGKTIRAVEVVYGGETFYIADDRGQGWLKVTKGRGDPGLGHESVPVKNVMTPRVRK